MKSILTCLCGTALALSLPAAVLPTSAPVQASTAAAGNSFNPIFSADGKHLIFVSHANNLVTNDDLGLSLDVFVRDLVSSNTVLVSVSASGTGGANADANYPSISSNGQFIAFASRASNLAANDTNDASDIFVRNVVNGTTRLVSVDPVGNNVADPNPSLNVPLSGNPIISPDGRWVFFESRATNLTADGVTPGDVYLYRRDLLSNVTQRASQSAMNAPNTIRHELGSTSSDGRFAAYTSRTNNGLNADVFVHDLNSGTSTLVSANVSNSIPIGGYRCSSPTLSDDGRYAAFIATPLSATGQFALRHDLQAGLTLVIGSAATNVSHGLQISADGRFVLFEEMDGSYGRIRLWDAQLNNSAFVSCGGDDPRGNAAMNAAATGIAFIGCSNVYAVGTQTLGVPVRASASTNGGASAGDYEFVAPVISPDGTRVAFAVTASDLVSGDLNGASDIFLRDVNAGVTELITRAQPVKPAATAFTHSFLGLNSISGDGRFLVTLRYDDPSAYRDTNGWSDVFITDLQAGTAKALSIDTNLYVSSGGAGPPTTNTVPNTNAYFAPMLGADGTTVAAFRRRGPSLGAPADLVLARSSNDVFGTGMALAVVDANRQPVQMNSVALSGNGLLLAFSTPASQVTPPYDNIDNNNQEDVYLRYYGTRAFNYFGVSNSTSVPTNFLLSVTTNFFTAGNGVSTNPVASTDGRWVAFATKASDLVPNTSAPYPALELVLADVGPQWQSTNYPRFPKELCSYTLSFQEFQWNEAANTNVHHTNLNAVLTPIPTDVGNAIFSGDQRALIYSLADGSAIWRHDITPRHTNVVLVAYTNTFGAIVATNVVPGATNLLVCTNCRNPSVSSDGNVIAYERVRGNGFVDLFATDVRAGGETLVSANILGALGNASSASPLLSADGRYVVFQSKASDLVPNDANGVSDIFVRDRVLGVTMLVSVNAQGLPGNGPSTRPVIGADGRTIVFQSFANDLVTGDYNDKRDIFVLKLGGADTDGDGMDDDWEVAYFGNLSRDGTSDFDGDGVSDRAEFLAGTDPTNRNSVFRVLTVTPVGGGSAQLIWSGNPTRQYRAEFKDDLSAAGWTAVNGTISWNGSTASITDTTATNGTHRYYRVARMP